MYKYVIKDKPIIYNNKDFQTIQIKLMFPFKRDDNNIAYIELLPNLLNYVNNKYPEEDLFALEKKNLYILNTSVYYRKRYNLEYIGFEFQIPDTYSLNKDLLDEQFEFFSEIIYNPKVKDNNFYEFELEREKKSLNIFIDNYLKKIDGYYNIRLNKLIDTDNVLNDDIFNNIDQIDKVNTSNIYEFYKEKILNNKPIIFIMGNVDNNRINDLCNKYLYKNNKKVVINEEINKYLKPRNNVLDIVEKSKFNDTILTIVYKVKDMKTDDEILLLILCNLLNSLSTRLLNKKLRDENELVYHSYAGCKKHFGIFKITAYVNKKNVEITKEKIFEVIDDLCLKDNISLALNNLRERERIDLIKQLDKKFFLFDNFITKKLKIDNTSDEYYEKLINITEDDIINFVKRLVLDTIYVLEEEDSNE